MGTQLEVSACCHMTSQPKESCRKTLVVVHHNSALPRFAHFGCTSAGSGQPAAAGRDDFAASVIKRVASVRSYLIRSSSGTILRVHKASPCIIEHGARLCPSQIQLSHRYSAVPFPARRERCLGRPWMISQLRTNICHSALGIPIPFSVAGSSELVNRHALNPTLALLPCPLRFAFHSPDVSSRV